jgi:hypothetical protein
MAADAVRKLDQAAHLLAAAGDKRRARWMSGLVRTIREAGTGIVVSAFLRDAASTRDVTDVREWLAMAPGVTDVRFVSKLDAYHRYLALFADSPELTRGVSPRALPASFEARLGSGEDGHEIRARVERFAAVEAVSVVPAFALQVRAFFGGRSSALATCSSPAG